MDAAYSLRFLTMHRARASLPNRTPGSETDRTLRWIPLRSIMCRAAVLDQHGTSTPPGLNSTLPQLARIEGWQNVLMMSILASPPNAPPTGVSIPNVFNTIMYPHWRTPKSSGADRRSPGHALFRAGPSPTETTQATRAPDVGTVHSAIPRATSRRFLDVGYRAAKLETIIHLAGFVKGTIYSSFSSEQDLVSELPTKRIAHYVNCVQKTLARSSDPSSSWMHWWRT